MILADIGNRHVHIWQDGRVTHLLLMDAIEKYGRETVYYINVNPDHAQTLVTLETWRDISEELTIAGEYEGMGIDRKALCLSHPDGIFVDAGSAITVDKVLDGSYQGGYILPGIHAYRKAYAEISPVLDLEINREVTLERLPKSTPESISFGVIAPLVASIEKIREGLPLYCTGGDGFWISKYFEQAVYDETLLFQGMLKMIEKVERC